AGGDMGPGAGGDMGPGAGDDGSYGLRAVAVAAARGAAEAARGNSGVILAQLIHGFAEALPERAGSGATGEQVAAALVASADCGYEAVARPVEGTILSVARAAGAGAVAAAGHQDGDKDREDGGDDHHNRCGTVSAADVLAAAVTAAESALHRTRSQLPVLARAGVVDAGGFGLLVVLRALAAALADESSTTEAPTTEAPGTESPAAGSPAGSSSVASPALASPAPESPAPESLDVPSLAVRLPAVDSLVAEESDGEPGRVPQYEVEYRLDAPAHRAADLRRSLSELGDSVVVAAMGSDQWNVHAHVDDAGAALEAGIDAGRPSAIRVSALIGGAPAAGARLSTAIVAIAPGPGLADLFASEGVGVVDRTNDAWPSTEDALPSADDVLARIREAGDRAVVILPCSAEVWPVAEAAAAAARADGHTVAVVPLLSPVQGLAAVAVHDPDRRFDDDVIAMAETAAGTRWAELTVADREALTMAGHCYPGEVLGLIGGEVVSIGRDVPTVAVTVLDLLLGVGGELVTVLLGAEAPGDVGRRLTEHVHHRAPHVEVTVLDGGQPDRPLLLGVE
ncbi:MAG: DAK2 domain-containing protein, partial [bacterium]